MLYTVEEKKYMTQWVRFKMKNLKIINCVIGPMPKDIFDEMPWIKVTFEDGLEKKLFQFYPDEISFNKNEIIGKTEKEVHQMKQKKDIEYLRS